MQYNSPRALITLMRLHKPLPLLLLLWPSLWGLVVAAEGWPAWKLLFVFSAGVGLMRTAGCILNDIADRHYDGSVTRTCYRPLATGEIAVKTAAWWAIACMAAAWALVWLLNPLSILLSLVAAALAACYPLCKRFMPIPQLVLGLAFNFGIVMAFAATRNSLPALAWWLYGAAILWTVAYDTIYALADLPDDQRIGLHSSARLFGRCVIPVICTLQAAFVLMMLMTGLLWLQAGWLYYLLLAGVAGCFVLQYRRYRNGSITACVAAFSANHWVGLLIFVALLQHYWLQP